MIRWKRSPQILQRDEALRSEDLAAPLRKGFRFDLCPACHRQVREGPARARRRVRSFDFSKN